MTNEQYAMSVPGLFTSPKEDDLVKVDLTEEQKQEIREKDRREVTRVVDVMKQIQETVITQLDQLADQRR